MTKNWEAYKATLYELYITRNKTLDYIIEHMKNTYGFDAAPRTYRQFFKKEGWGKYKRRTDPQGHPLPLSRAQSPIQRPILASLVIPSSSPTLEWLSNQQYSPPYANFNNNDVAYPNQIQNTSPDFEYPTLQFDQKSDYAADQVVIQVATSPPSPLFTEEQCPSQSYDPYHNSNNNNNGFTYVMNQQPPQSMVPPRYNYQSQYDSRPLTSLYPPITTTITTASCSPPSSNIACANRNPSSLQSPNMLHPTYSSQYSTGWNLQSPLSSSQPYTSQPSTPLSQTDQIHGYYDDRLRGGYFEDNMCSYSSYDKDDGADH